MHQINHNNWTMDTLAAEPVIAVRPDYDRIRKKRDEERKLATEKHNEWLKAKGLK